MKALAVSSWTAHFCTAERLSLGNSRQLAPPGGNHRIMSVLATVQPPLSFDLRIPHCAIVRKLNAFLYVLPFTLQFLLPAVRVVRRIRAAGV